MMLRRRKGNPASMGIPTDFLFVAYLALVTGVFTTTSPIAFGQTAEDGGNAEDLWLSNPPRSIFNGESLDGWVVEGAQTTWLGDPVWHVRDKKIVCRGSGFGFLRYTERLGDFRVALEFRMSEGCNSGVGLRGEKYTSFFFDRPSIVGYEVQILDDAGERPTTTSSGSLYRYVAPQKNAIRAAGKWNEMVIVCCGPTIRVTLNGQRVIDIDQSRREPLRDKPLAGYLSLQNHGHAIEFRNIALVVPEVP